MLFDGMDALIVEAFHDQPREQGEIHDLRVALQTVFGRLSTQEAADQRAYGSHLLGSRAASEPVGRLVSTVEFLREVLAERTGRQPGDLALRSLAGAVMGVTIAVMDALDDDPTANIGTLLDEALGHLEAGLDV